MGAPYQFNNYKDHYHPINIKYTCSPRSSEGRRGVSRPTPAERSGSRTPSQCRMCHHSNPIPSPERRQMMISGSNGCHHVYHRPLGGAGKWCKVSQPQLNACQGPLGCVALGWCRETHSRTAFLPPLPPPVVQMGVDSQLITLRMFTGPVHCASSW